MTEEERTERADSIVYSCDSRAELASYIVRLEAERDDLRELVRDIYASATFWLDHFGEGHKFHNRMRELGVEI